MTRTKGPINPVGVPRKKEGNVRPTAAPETQGEATPSMATAATITGPNTTALDAKPAREVGSRLNRAAKTALLQSSVGWTP